jgi:hypothetical protein
MMDWKSAAYIETVHALLNSRTPVYSSVAEVSLDRTTHFCSELNKMIAGLPTPGLRTVGDGIPCQGNESDRIVGARAYCGNFLSIMRISPFQA